jgi:hypothetical protein
MCIGEGARKGGECRERKMEGESKKEGESELVKRRRMRRPSWRWWKLPAAGT